jgi:hypothetical protein
MHGLVAETLQQAEASHLLAGQVAEGAGAHQIRQSPGGKGPLQLGIVVVHPLHEQLDGAAGVEAGGARIGERELLHLARLRLQLGPGAGDGGALGGHPGGRLAMGRLSSGNGPGEIPPDCP